MPSWFDERTHYRRKFAFDAKTRFWRKTDGQRARFEAVFRQIDFSASAIYDVGCGSGDLLAHAVARGTTPRSYVGVDIVPEFIEEATFRSLPGHFACRDVASFEAGVDWAVAIGLFGHAQTDTATWWDRMHRITEQMWLCSARGIAYTLTSTLSPQRSPEAYYTEPHKAFFDATDRFGWRVIVDHSYLINDFLVVCKKQ